MSDNGDKENLEQKPTIDPNAPQEILRVDLIGTKLQPHINSNFLPMLCFALELLRVEIDKMIIDTKINAQQSGIIIPKKHRIIDWMRRR